jgi:hypothetical protein
MRDWLSTATACNCDTLDVCALFDETTQPAPDASDAPALNVTYVGT